MNTKKLTAKEFYTLSFTWGIIMTLIGCFVSLAMIIAGYHPKKNCYGWYFETEKRGWGGIEIGPMHIVNRNPSEYLLNHEFGHGVQNCYFGPFMIIISLWSAARYQYRKYLRKVKKIPSKNLPKYDDIWFEGQATKIGEFYRTHS